MLCSIVYEKSNIKSDAYLGRKTNATPLLNKYILKIYAKILQCRAGSLGRLISFGSNLRLTLAPWHNFWQLTRFIAGLALLIPLCQLYCPFFSGFFSGAFSGASPLFLWPQQTSLSFGWEGGAACKQLKLQMCHKLLSFMFLCPGSQWQGRPQRADQIRSNRRRYF